MRHLKSHFLLAFAAMGLLSTAKAMTSYHFNFNLDQSFTEVTVDGAKKIQVPLEEIQSGLLVLHANAIAKKIGNQENAAQHPFSFAGATNIKIEAISPATHFLVTSFKKSETNFEPKKVSQFVILLANKTLWNFHEFVFEGTTFQLLSPKESPQTSGASWEKAVRQIWLKYLEKFGTATEHLAFVDLKGPVSGGPLGEYVLAFFANDQLSPAIKDDMKANLGWNSHPTTKSYVQAYYPKSSAPWDEYLIGTYAHEIGHLYFGFGITRERITSADDLWFSLGLGMLYDMEITKDILGREPQLEMDLIKTWKNSVSRIKDIDHRLIGPNKTADSKYKFDRKKVFAHGKAAFFLGELRREIGIKKFDEAVLQYLKSCTGCEGGYTDFKKFLGDDVKKAAALERKYNI